MDRPAAFRLISPAAALLLAGGLAFAAEFDVASLKQIQLPNGNANTRDTSFVGKGGVPFQVSGNRITLQGTLRRFIVAAYGIRDYQVSALPAWSDSVAFALTAKAPGDAAPSTEEVRSMLQALLADRFQLKFHRESREVPVFELSVVKQTSAFKPAGPDEKFNWGLSNDKEGVHSKATREPIEDFVELVGVSAGRPVINKTGITGFIDYDILFSQDGIDSVQGMDVRILEAVRKQLGMKLEAAKDNVDFLIIDAVQKPSEN